jgi:hypothetical protein
MTSSETKNRLGYMVLTIGVILGLFAAFRNDSNIRDVNDRQTNFIIQQCERDDSRNDIVIESLRGAKRRAIVTYRSNADLLYIEVQRIQDQIDEFKNSPPCRLP